MTSSQDFWARKLARQRVQAPVPPPQHQLIPRVDRPWWQSASGVPENVPQMTEFTPSGHPQRARLTDKIVVELDEHGQYRPRGASHLKRSGHCPECDSGNFGGGGDQSRAKRCFDCGYVEGRSIADPNRPAGATTDAPARKARQITTMNIVDNTGLAIGKTTAASGAVPNDHTIIDTVSQAVAYIGAV